MLTEMPLENGSNGHQNFIQRKLLHSDLIMDFTWSVKPMVVLMLTEVKLLNGNNGKFTIKIAKTGTLLVHGNAFLSDLTLMANGSVLKVMQ